MGERIVKAGHQPERIRVKLAGQSAITLRCLRTITADGTPYKGDLNDLVFAEPKYTPREK